MSTPTLAEIRQQFPKAHYAPDPSCKRCGGTGITGPRKVIVIDKDADGKWGSHIEERPEEGGQGCICIYVGDPAIRDIVQDGLKQLAAEHKAAMQAR